MLSLSETKTLLVQTGKEVLDDDVPSLAAAIAYYAVFSLPPLLVAIVAIAGAVAGPGRVEAALAEQIGGMAGGGVSDAVSGMIEQAGDLGSGLGAKIAGALALLFGASGAFGQLQKALNRAWEVEPEPESGLVRLVAKRLLSFGMVVTIALLLLVSLAIDAVLGAAGTAAGDLLPSEAARVGITAASFALSLGVTAGLFATVFKVLPDAEIRWRDVAVGALVTAALFAIGKAAIGLYIGASDPGSAFGAAGALALILLWIYYTSLILLVGAEFTQIWATRYGAGIRPDDAADDVHPLAQERPPAPRSGVTPAARS